MKSFKVILLILVALVTVCGCSVEKENGDVNYLTSISYTELKDMLEDKQSFFVEIVQDGCSACQSFTPKLLSVLESYGVTGFQINLSEMSENEYLELDEKFKISGTPTVIFFTDGEEKSSMQRIEQNIPKSQIVSRLKSTGYIEK